MFKLRAVGAAVGAACLVLPFVPGSALASKGGGGGGGSAPPAPLHQTAEWTSSNPYAPSWCLTEDDFDQRTFSGSLSGSDTTSYRLCGVSDFFGNIWWDAGGIGLESDVYVVGQLSGLTITAPDGAVRQAVLMGQSTTRGVTTSHYAVCETPPYSVSSGVAGTSLAGGSWQLTLSGQLSSASWTTTAAMTSASYQQTNCPVSEQNLMP